MKFLIMVVVLVLSGCGTINRSDMNVAEYACTPYGGVHAIHRNDWTGDKVTCSTGKVIMIREVIDEYSQHVAKQNHIIRD